MASGLDINGCVLSYFEGKANVHCYTSCKLTTLHCCKVSFLQRCHMKRYNKIFTHTHIYLSLHRVRLLLSMEGLRALRIHQKYLNLCVWGGITDDEGE